MGYNASDIMAAKADNQQLKEKDKVPALIFLKDEISREALQIVKTELKDKKSKKLFLVIRSYGGDAYTAVRIIRHIQTKFDEIIGVVPDYAYSAAVLLLMGTNKIYVSSEGSIAPIDKPMEHSPTGDSISALDVTQSLTNISALVSQMAREFYSTMRGTSQNYGESINKQEALAVAWDSSVKIVQPLIQQIDPVLLQKCYRDLRIGLYYGMDLLNDRMFPNDLLKSYEISSKLVNTYPSHGYAIFRDEMSTLGLNVGNIEDIKNNEKILKHYSATKNDIKYIDNIND